MTNFHSAALVVISGLTALACSTGSGTTHDNGSGGTPGATATGGAGTSAGNVSTGGTGPGTGGSASTAATGTGGSAALPLDLPGVVLWLDGDVGIVASGSASMTWTDRSAFRHVFTAQSADGTMPAMAQLNGHGAVRFTGRNRFISEQTPTPAQRDALSLGSNFVVALVFVPERKLPQGAILTLAMLPWIPVPPEDLVLPPYSAPAFGVGTGTGPSSLVFDAAGSTLNIEADFALSPQRLILSTEGGNRVGVRLNGQLQPGTPAMEVPAYEGAYAPIYVGSWDFDIPGLEGTVAEMVIIRGGADAATEEALDNYLKRKFSL